MVVNINGETKNDVKKTAKRLERQAIAFRGAVFPANTFDLSRIKVSTLLTPPPSSLQLAAFLHLWLLYCFDCFRQCLQIVTERMHLLMELIKTDKNRSIYKNLNESFCSETCRESGYLSSGSVSSKYGQSERYARNLEAISRFSSAIFVEQTDEIPDFDSTGRFLVTTVDETKYITAIFEAPNGGIDRLIVDILDEFDLWFREKSRLLGIACEVHWSVPEKLRDRNLEIRMKQGLHATLRRNNRAVMDEKNDGFCGWPWTLEEAKTQEDTFTDMLLHCFQGVYRRFYPVLLDHQHSETALHHGKFWKLSLDGPNPQHFLLGSKPNKLINTTLVSVNLIALRMTR